MKRLLEWIWQKLPSAFSWLREKLAVSAIAMWASVVAMFKSPAVWLASFLVFVLGFSAGHIERSRAVRALQAERNDLLVARDTLIVEKDSMAKALAAARKEAADAKAALSAVSPPAPAKSPPAVKPAPAKKVGKVKQTSADARIRNPFGE